MRNLAVLIALLLLPVTAVAQVTIDLHALDPLPGSSVPPPGSVPGGQASRPASRQTATPKSHGHGSAAATPAPVTTNPATPPAPEVPPATASAAPNQPSPAPVPPPPAATLPTAVPPVVAIAPIAPPPAEAEPPPPPPPPISPSAESAAEPRGAGLRVTFGAGQADLSPDSAQAIAQLVRTAPTSETTSFNVIAYAAGTPDDPSTARRLSLSRALAVRSALIADGVNSSRIYVRALGAASGDGPGDRVDLTVLGGNATQTSAPAQSAPPKSQSQ